VTVPFDAAQGEPTEPSDAALLGLNRAATIARLVAGAIHDVNNALMVISGTIDIIESRPDTPPTLHEALARLRAQSSRAASTLAQVQTFTRAERGASEPFNLREVAEQALALRDFAIRRARLTARVEVEGSAAFVVRGNRGDLQQVLLNLITNAEQALAGRTGAAIVVRLSHEGDMVALSVIDEGAGVGLLPPERAFQAFVTTRDPFESAGLGLWASLLLVEQQGGTLRLEPSSNGTIVTMRLPGVMIGR
jgi:signal transduction histidine kinase